MLKLQSFVFLCERWCENEGVKAPVREAWKDYETNRCKAWKSFCSSAYRFQIYANNPHLLHTCDILYHFRVCVFYFVVGFEGFDVTYNYNTETILHPSIHAEVLLFYWIIFCVMSFLKSLQLSSISLLPVLVLNYNHKYFSLHVANKEFNIPLKAEVITFFLFSLTLGIFFKLAFWNRN